MKKTNCPDYDYLTKSACPTDCTGLIPTGHVSEEQLAAYQEVYHFGTAKIADTMKEDAQKTSAQKHS
ncbi:hypothetical protein SAMN02910358_00832 [Lachnospiraceae bacterium XBB1006]|nr:hypothetical protein SAMN02910358_00832 [Lachnospiraceae bacterium XBB1006]